MTEPVDPYQSNAVRTARAIGVFGTLTTCLGGPIFVMMSDLPGFIGALCLVFGLTPYLLSIKHIEPWLAKRQIELDGASKQGDRSDEPRD